MTNYKLFFALLAPFLADGVGMSCKAGVMTFVKSPKLSCILLARTEISLRVFAYEYQRQPGAGDTVRLMAERLPQFLK